MLKISNLAISHGGKRVLSDLSLHAGRGELTAILGASGAGKSTLLRLIAGFERPTSGEIWLDNTQIAGDQVFVAPEHRGIGIVPQDSALFSHLSVSDNVGFGLPKSPSKAARVQELLKLVGLEEYANRKPASLSGGQQQRVALARALAPKPKLILLDEPFSALDQELRARLRDDVKRVLKAENATAILVTHDQEEALSLAEKVAVLRDGRIIQAGAPTEIYNAPADLGIATFLGDSVLVDGVVVGDKIETDLGKLSALNSVTEGERGVVAIRSENFYLQPKPGGDSEVVG